MQTWKKNVTTAWNCTTHVTSSGVFDLQNLIKKNGAYDFGGKALFQGDIYIVLVSADRGALYTRCRSSEKLWG